MGRAIVTYGDRGTFPAGVERQGKAHALVRTTIQWLPMYQLPADYKRFRERRNLFKLYAMREAHRAGFTSVMWWDSSIWAVRDPVPAFDALEEHGVYLLNLGEINGVWTNDVCLNIMGVTREEAMQQLQVISGFWGVNFNDPRGKALFDEMWEHAHAKVSPYDGPKFAEWMPEKHRWGIGWVSNDKRVRGHRSDQSVLSCIAYRDGLHFYRSFPCDWWGAGHLEYVRDDGPYRISETTVAVANGAKGPHDLRGIPYP